MRRALRFACLAAPLSLAALSTLGFPSAVPATPEPPRGALSGLGPPSVAPSNLGPASAAEIAAAITELDLERARKLLGRAPLQAPELLMERARLAVHESDCALAEQLLTEATVGEESGLVEFAAFARRCAGATVGGVVVNDTERGVWLRLQDAEDRVLVPWILDVATRARDAMERDLSVRLPWPLRIELVRDLFSLSAVSGLALEAAETTGTVAVARFGRVTMISPRAAPYGYPWQDTLAHEIAHLSLSRATADHAPLWLQEGVAKIQETRWRESRLLESESHPDRTAQAALLAGDSLAIDQIGPSIAMLPTAEAASTTFAAVESFVRFWIRQNGTPAFWLLLADLRGLASSDPDRALVSTTGYPLRVWLELWQRDLRNLAREPKAVAANQDPREVTRDLKLAELFFEHGEPEAAESPARRALGRSGFASDARAPSPRAALARSLLSQALLARGRPWAARRALSAGGKIEGVHAEFLALLSRFELEAGRGPEAAAYLDHALSLNPLAELVACGGHARRLGTHLPSHWAGVEQWSLGEKQRTLCESVRGSGLGGETGGRLIGGDHD